MKALIVIAHPLSDSLCHGLARVAEDALATAGHTVQRHDLYQSGLHPALSAEERRNYYGTPPFDRTAAAELAAAEILVLVFPTWWFGFPAVLKGWFDRVWMPGVAFDHAPGGAAIRPRLMQLKHVIAITTLGAPRWVDWLVMRQPVKRVLKYGIVAPCAPHARLLYRALHSAETVTAERHANFAASIRSILAGLR
jgi:putative NADPH-quinone reductase